MIKIIHRINTVEELKKLPKDFGVEVDVRTRNNRLILNHEPFGDGQLLDDYLSEFNHAFIVLELKEEGIEKDVIALAEKHGINNYFLLSVTPPFMWKLFQKDFRKIAVRFSEWESIETCFALRGKVEWVWIDTFATNPLNADSYTRLKSAGFKLCLVSPDRWDRPADIPSYVRQFKYNNVQLDAVMVGGEHANKWV